MPADTSVPGGISRRPQASIVVNGRQMSGLMSMVVQRNNHFAADTYAAVIALDLGAGSQTTPGWVQDNSVEVSLAIAGDSGIAVRVITGLVDDLALDFSARTITVSGRDYTSLFIEAKTAEKFQNLTSSQVVETLAARQGLTAQAQVTTTPVGKFYDSDHADVTNEISEWTLLTYLAEREGFDIFVEGTTLFFQPPADPGRSLPFDVLASSGSTLPSANVLRLVMRRSLTLAKDVIVTVISWNHEMKTAVTATRRAKKPNSGDAASRALPTRYVFREAGLNQSQANALAAAKLVELTQHERRIEFELPGDLALNPRSLIRLSGTGTDFDQLYYTAQLELRFTQAQGFLMRVKAKNASPHAVVDS